MPCSSPESFCSNISRQSYSIFTQLFHQSSSLPTYPYANTFFTMIPPPSIAYWFIFWIPVSNNSNVTGLLSVTPFTCLLQICTLLMIVCCHSPSRNCLHYSLFLHTLVWRSQTLAIVSTFTSMQKSMKTSSLDAPFSLILWLVLSLHSDVLLMGHLENLQALLVSPSKLFVFLVSQSLGQDGTTLFLDMITYL